MKEKIQKILSHAGIASRRKIEKLIKLGLVEINRKKIKIGERINANFISRISVNKKLYFLNNRKKNRMLLYNKPLGEICTCNDPKKRITVFDNLPKLSNERWISIGRLDINTKGLLLFTTNGNIANQLMHPKFNIYREYLVRAFGKLDINKINNLNNQNKFVNKKYKKYQKITFYKKNNANKWFKVLINSGEKHEVRKLFQSINFQVNQLIRIKYGIFNLPKNLYPGKFIEINPINVL